MRYSAFDFHELKTIKSFQICDFTCNKYRVYETCSLVDSSPFGVISLEV